MGWGIIFTTDIYLSKQSYPNKMSVEEKIEELNKYLVEIETKIKMYASSTPKDIIPNEWNEEPIEWYNNQMSGIFEWYNDVSSQLFKLQLYLEYLNDGGEIIKSE